MNTFAISGLLCVDYFSEPGDVEYLAFQRIFWSRDLVFILCFEYFETMGDIGNYHHFVFHTVKSRACAPKVCPAAAGISGRKPAVFNKDMIWINLPEFSNDTVYISWLSIDDRPKHVSLIIAPERSRRHVLQDQPG